MDKQRSRANDAGRLRRPFHGIGEHGLAKALPRFAPVHGQTRQDNRRDRVRAVVAESGWGLVPVRGTSLSQFVNQLLKKDIELIEAAR